MEPQITDFYNELPYGINVIEKLNNEYDDLLKKIDEKDKKIEQLIKYFNEYHGKVMEYKKTKELEEIIRIINQNKKPKKKKFSCF